MLSTLQDIEVEREDQQRINLFARKNAKLLDMREKIAEKEVRNARTFSLAISSHSLFSQKELQNMEDASDELMMADSDNSIPYPPNVLS